MKQINGALVLMMALTCSSAAGAAENSGRPPNPLLQTGQVRGLLARQYPRIREDLDLTQEEVDRLFDLIARQREELSAGLAGFLSRGAEGNPAGNTAGWRAQRLHDHDAEQAVLLGRKYQLWMDYQAMPTASNMVASFLARLGESGAATLNTAQVRSLEAALSAEQGHIDRETRVEELAGEPRNGQEALQRVLERNARNHPRLVKAAATQLDAAHLDVFRQMLAAQDESTRNLLRSTGGVVPAQAR